MNVAVDEADVTVDADQPTTSSLTAAAATSSAALSSADADHRRSHSKKRARRRSGQKVAVASDSDQQSAASSIRALAAARKLTRADRDRLFAAAKSSFDPTVVLTRSKLQQWQTNISDENVNNILLRHNVDRRNKLVQSMDAASKQRQQTIFDSFRKK